MPLGGASGVRGGEKPNVVVRDRFLSRRMLLSRDGSVFVQLNADD